MVELNRADDVSRIYARLLAWGTRIGLALLVAGLLAYLLGFAPHVPMDQLPVLWKRPAADLLAASSLSPGWSWAALVHRSDMFVLAAIALLASCSIPCLVVAARSFARRRETPFVIMCLLLAAVLLLAASGLFATGH